MTQNLLAPHYRPMTPNDQNFIYSTWLKSYRQMPANQNMSNDVFFHYHKQIVEKIINKSNVQVTMITDPTDANHIYGYTVIEWCGSVPIIHYVYTKHTYRRLGLLSNLIKELIPDFGQKTIFVTHESRHHKVFKAKFGLEYNPHLI